MCAGFGARVPTSCVAHLSTGERSFVKSSVQKLMFGLIAVIVLAFILMRGDQLTELVDTMSRGAALPLVLAVVTQLGKYYAQSWGYHFSFKTVGEDHMMPRETIKLVFGTFFVNTIAPSANMAGATLVVDDSRRRGIPAGKAASAALLMQITIDSAFMCLMIIAFIVLNFTGNLNPAWFLLGLLVFAVVGFAAGVIVVGAKSPQTLKNFLYPIERFVNRVLAKFHKDPLKPWVDRAVASFSDAGKTIRTRPKDALKAFGCSGIASCCELACFCLVGVAFTIYDPEPLVCGYVVATLFAMFSPVPQGVGFVEAADMVLFSAYGINSAAGMATVMVYRGIVFWMPFLIGAVLIQFTKTFRGDKKDSKEDKQGLIESVAAGNDLPIPDASSGALAKESPEILAMAAAVRTAKATDGAQVIAGPSGSGAAPATSTRPSGRGAASTASDRTDPSSDSGPAPDTKPPSDSESASGATSSSGSEPSPNATSSSDGEDR
jgi:uncharacterized protein (TIRG00374 family)